MKTKAHYARTAAKLKLYNERLRAKVKANPQQFKTPDNATGAADFSQTSPTSFLPLMLF